MATKHIRTTPAEGKPTPPAAPWDWSTDFGRQQLAVGAESASTLLRGFQEMRSIQEQAAREASEHHAALAGKLRKCTTPMELIALQGELVRYDFEAAARYWQLLAGAAMELGTELCACGTQLVDTEDLLAATSARFLHS
jgi:hypothetical protein